MASRRPAAQGRGSWSTSMSNFTSSPSTAAAVTVTPYDVLPSRSVHRTSAPTLAGSGSGHSTSSGARPTVSASASLTLSASRPAETPVSAPARNAHPDASAPSSTTTSNDLMSAMVLHVGPERRGFPRFSAGAVATRRTRGRAAAPLVALALLAAGCGGPAPAPSPDPPPAPSPTGSTGAAPSPSPSPAPDPPP